MYGVSNSRSFNKPRLNIGYLDDNIYCESYSKILAGILEAAQKYDINMIRFGYYASHSAYKSAKQANMVMDHIEQYNLDGLLFLGWTKAAIDDFDDFKSRFDSIPIFSIGTGYESIPHVYFNGSNYVHEMLNHLICIHHYKKIAYIAPYRPDNRNETYIKLMKENGLYNADLYIGEKELANQGRNLHERGKKAVKILLDERKVSFDAIVSLYNPETESILNELRKRGIGVPEDVAVVSYEDGDIAKCSSPALTTVYFPWRELGYSGCENIVKILDKSSDSNKTSIPGRVIYRNSCGCTPNSLAVSTKKILKSEKALNELNDFEIRRIIKEIKDGFPNISIDFEHLMEAFSMDYEKGTSTCFLTALSEQIRKVSPSGNYSNVEDIISLFRKLLLPYTISSEKVLLWSGNIFQQAQVMIREKIASVKGYQDVQAKNLSQTLQEISQELVTNYNISSLLDSLEENLPKLNIPSCYLFLFNSETKEDNINPFQCCDLAFEYRDYKRVHLMTDGNQNAKMILSKMIFPEDKASTLFAHLLHVTDEFLGFILFEAGPIDERVYQALSVHISTSIRGALLLEKLNNSYKDLVKQAHREGMADIAIGILHNVGNALNSVNSSIQMMKEVIGVSPIEDIRKANELLEMNFEKLEHFISNDDKGKKLMQFYLKLGSSIKEFQSKLHYQINRLDYKINSINDVITAQQNYAGIKTTMEELDLISVIQDVLKMHVSLMDSYKIDVSTKFHSMYKIMGQRVKLFHVMVNLIKNAIDSMMDSDEYTRKLSITVAKDEKNTCVRVTDYGCGIPSHSLEKIFSFGYTTKKHGHGIGLHTCMNYMKEMDGRIYVESDGTGKGSTFVLEFPNI